MNENGISKEAWIRAAGDVLVDGLADGSCNVCFVRGDDLGIVHVTRAEAQSAQRRGINMSKQNWYVCYAVENNGEESHTVYIGDEHPALFIANCNMKNGYEEKYRLTFAMKISLTIANQLDDEGDFLDSEGDEE
jgi:hypothetical protein